MLDRALQTIRGVNATLRVICGELHPSTLVHLGVEKAIRSHAARLQEHFNGTTLHLELQSDPPNLSHTLRLGLYRTYQQLVDNAVQHAAAADIWLRLRFLPRHIILEVQDNGQGFEKPDHWVELVRQGKLGLVSTLERVKSLNGQLQLETSPGNGTLVIVSLPVE
jgi:two-component system sensor histidine kinase DegS